MLRQPSRDRDRIQISGAKETSEAVRKLVRESRESIDLILPSATLQEKSAELLDLIAPASQGEKKGPKIRLLVPSSFDEALLETPQFSKISWRKVDHDSEGVWVFDKRVALIFESEQNAATLVQDSATLRMLISIINALWKEAELRETGDMARRELIDTLSREEKAKRQAQLLQDILTHDIRNYNQVTRLSAELLKEELQEDTGVQLILDSIIRAIDGSTEFLERAKRLGRAISEQDPRLYPVSLFHVIDKSYTLIRTAYSKKEIMFTVEMGDSNTSIPIHEMTGKRLPALDYLSCNVVADDLLVEVFSNILSNSVKYTDQDTVNIDCRIDKVDEKPDSPGKPMWKVTVADRGHGIPEKDKPNIFSRYLRGARGIGLGMSIIHALVVDRYGGSVSVRNRVEGDHTQGTVIEMFLHRSP